MRNVDEKFGEPRSVGNYTAASMDAPYFDVFASPSLSRSILLPATVSFPIPRKHPVKRGNR